MPSVNCSENRGLFIIVHSMQANVLGFLTCLVDPMMNLGTATEPLDHL